MNEHLKSIREFAEKALPEAERLLVEEDAAFRAQISAEGVTTPASERAINSYGSTARICNLLKNLITETDRLEKTTN